MIPKIATYLPEIDEDGVKVQRFTLDQEASDWHRVRCAMNGEAWRYAPPGDYTRVIIDGELWMSDTRAEVNDHAEPYRRATGHVLITGLGAGMIANACALKPEVTTVTVVERDPRIVRLIGPHMPPKVTIIQADALEWRGEEVAGRRFSVAWHDIWVDICLTNKPQMSKLNRRWGRRADWSRCWGQRDIEHMMRRMYR